MKLDKLHEAVIAADEMPGQLVCKEGLARAWRAVDNGLLFAVEGAEPAFKLSQSKARVFRTLFDRIRDWWFS